jgi:hypothetical protein
MISRRAFVASAAATLFSTSALAALPVPAARALTFQIMRKGDRIGTHALQFQRSGDQLKIDIAVDMLVKFGPIPVFRYKHRTIEQWRAGLFSSLDSKTDNDGEAAFATVRREAEGLIVEGSKTGRYTAPANALASTHWNIAELAGPMINPENGKLLTPRVVDKGFETIRTAAGHATRATRYSWRDDGAIDLWYDNADIWTALVFHAEDGSVVNYELV